MNDLLVKFCEEKGIKYKIENVDILREKHITFSKDGKHYRKIIPYEETQSISFEKLYSEQLKKEIEENLLSK